MFNIRGPEPQVAVLHAFSRRNAGDGLLVDLTLELLADAGVPRDRCTVFALDPESFSDLPNVRRAPGEPSARPSRKAARAAADLGLSYLGTGDLHRQLSRVDGLVAVGGGYLVADSIVRRMGLVLNHLAQLRTAAKHRAPTIYLPQSIGPLTGWVGRQTRRLLSHIDLVCVRDDATMAELRLPNVRRHPDLAVMKIAQNFDAHLSAVLTDGYILVGRGLPRAGEYVPRLNALALELGNVRWAVQADIEGHRSDRTFYRAMGVRDHGSLACLLQSPSGPVISVRLHGAIAAILAGRPAIHLAYERKGWGSYEDLGLSPFVHDARSFDPSKVAEQARRLAIDPNPFWERIAEARSRCNSLRDDLVREVGKILRLENNDSVL